MSQTLFLNGMVSLHKGDSRDVIATLPDNSVDSGVCDPPYALVSIVKRFGKTGSAAAKPEGMGGAYRRLSGGFMGKQWDTGEVAFDPAFWSEVLRVLKPGGHLLAFSGTRTYHRMACAIEDAGFEIRDQIGWAYGSGFPKSKNLDGEWEGWGTALKPAWEPIVMARKPLSGKSVSANVAEHGVGAINVDGCRVHADDHKGGTYTVKRLKPVATLNATGGNWRPDGDTIKYHGEMKPGRWPANIIHDGSEEVLSCFPDAPGQLRAITGDERAHRTQNAYGDFGTTREGCVPREDEGSAARFFYQAKADSGDRLGSKHPTVKPIDLMQYLVRLVTPKGGTVLDPFAGTGTTGEAAWREGMRAILIEREEEYQADIARRMDLADKPTKRAAVANSKNNLETAENLPLFKKVQP